MHNQTSRACFTRTCFIRHSPDSGDFGARIRAFERLEQRQIAVETALENDPAFAGAIRLDEFRDQTMVAAPLPWDPNWWEPGRGKTSTTLALCCGCKIMEFWSVVLSFMKLLTQSQKLMPITR